MSKLNGNLSIFNQLKPVSVGFENMFDSFEKMFENDGFESLDNYPYYNIVKTGDYTYDIELALAGFSKKDISIEYADGLLKIKSVKQNKKVFLKDTLVKLSPYPMIQKSKVLN